MLLDQPRTSRPSIPKKRSTIRGKDGHRWNLIATKRRGRAPRRNIVVSIASPKGVAKNVKAELESFHMFFDPGMMSMILKFANEEIARQRVKFGANQSGLNDTSMLELHALIGLIIYIGAHKLCKTSTEVIWHRMRGLRIVPCVMPQRRFSFLVNCLRFDDRHTRSERKILDPLAPIRDLWDSLIKNCIAHFNPGCHVTVDEQLLAFRGKCPFRMFIPSKTAKYGLKIVMLCDSQTGYMVNGIVYTGKKCQ